MAIKPLHDRVLVRRLEEEQKTAGGIIIPDSAKEKPTRGEIVAVGNGAKDEKGNALGSDGDPQVRNNRQGCCQDCPDKYRRCGQFERNRQTGNEPDESLPEKTEIDHCLAPHPARRAILGEAEEKRRDHGDCQIEQSSRDKELKRSAR